MTKKTVEPVEEKIEAVEANVAEVTTEATDAVKTEAEVAEKTSTEVETASTEAKPAKKVVKKTKKTEKLEKAEEKKEESANTADVTEADEAAVAKKAPRARGKRYVQARARVDKTRSYSAVEAIALAKRTHIGRFSGSMEAHLVLREAGLNVNVTYPFSTGASVKVAIVNDDVLAELDKGIISFTHLIAHPSMMPKIAKYARLLGPKGLMPNPKTGTVSPDPEKRKKELEGGATTVKAERKAPLVHTVIGKLAQADSELAANLETLIKAYPAGKVLKCTVCSSMGPAVKVVVG